MTPGDFNLASCNANYTIIHRSIGISGSPTKLTAADPSRVGIIFSDGAGVVFLGGSNVSSATVFDIYIPSQFQENRLIYSEFGTLVQQEWWAVRTSGLSTLNVTEVLYRPAAGVVGLAGGAEVIH